VLRSDTRGKRQELESGPQANPQLHEGGVKTTRLTELPVKHLDYVFSPPGLPLPAKSDSAFGTTSVLVRGGAGTGKTTFALALAHSIATTNEGLVLYLTTEFSPVEITFKATLIRLQEEAVDAWPGRKDMQVGGVIVEHLSEVRRGRPVLSSAERRRSSIDAVWGLLHPTNEDAIKPGLPVRSVVIDALTLPEVGENDSTQRADLVAFVQALENEGISVVLVEELAPGAPAWSSFVVDVVFELAFQPDPETQDLRRKLTLSKCRYALSIPGPHDYGLEDGSPAVWPDLFRVVTIAHRQTGTDLFRATAPRLALPLAIENQWTLLNASVILSPYDMAPVTASRVLQHTPGTKRLNISCGARTSIGTSLDRRYVNEDDGVHAIGWASLAAATATNANLCFINNIERLLSRPDSTARAGRLIEALRIVGFMVCVNSPRLTMRPLDATADYIWDGSKHGAVTQKPRRHVSSIYHFLTMPWMEELEKLIEPTYISATIDDLRTATISSLDGHSPDKQMLENLLAEEAPLGHHAAWFALHTGSDWLAAHSALASIESEKPAPTMLLLWKAICAAIAKNLTAIEELKSFLGTPEEAIIIGPLLRALGGTNQLDEADRIIADVGARHNFEPWIIARLRADTRLDAESPVFLHDAVQRLGELAGEPSLDRFHRAEVLHNLGSALNRLGQYDKATVSFERASAFNPSLDAAREELERLQASKPAPG
jgi:KaiC/GvpD/RAD55 family RecA-like ATPase/tetratricopeptide (TPR) repeat protein